MKNYEQRTEKGCMIHIVFVCFVFVLVFVGYVMFYVTLFHFGIQIYVQFVYDVDMKQGKRIQ